MQLISSLSRLAVSCVSMLALLRGLSAETQAQEVSFPDSHLESGVRQVLEKPAGPITVDDMLTLTQLDVGGQNIADTTGLETAVNLTNLVFNSNPVTNYSGISCLSNLAILRFDTASVSNIHFLTNLTRLEILEIYQNQIQDISPLVGLTNLRTLQLDWNPVTNHPALSGLTNLTSLHLSGNSISNADFLVPLGNLQALGLYVNAVTDISPLTSLTNLAYLSLGWNGVTNPAVLASMTGLRELHLNGNSLTNVSYLAGLTNLFGLDLGYTTLADMSPVTNLTRLEWVNIGENLLTNLANLSPLTNLATLMMAGNYFTDLSPVTNLPALRELHVQRSRFTTIAPLTHCRQLDRLLLEGNHLANPDEIGALTTLNGLEIQNMGLTNIDFLATLVELDGLNLADNQVTDLSPLTNLPALWWLSAEQNRLQEIASLENMPSLAYLNLRLNFLDTHTASPAWNVITNLQERGVTVDYDPQLIPPLRPQILIPPARRSAFPGDTVSFSVVADTNSPAPEFRWQKNGVDLENDSRISGADSATLTISDLTDADAGFYRVRIWRDWAVTNSPAAELKVITSVAFADPNLEAAVREALEIPSDPLTPADLAVLDSLDLSYRGITNLSGLEAAANLAWLNLSGNSYIADVSPLGFLGLLGELAFNDAQMDDLQWITGLGLPSLTALQVNANYIGDLSPLRWLPNLAALSATENQLTNINPLLDLPALTTTVQLGWNRLDTNATSAAWGVITNLTARGATVEYDPQLPAPIPPVIITQPASLVAFPGDNISFSVVATGSGSGLNYRWLKNGVNIDDAPRLGGVVGDTLSIDDVQGSDAGRYQVRVRDENGVTRSREATLRVVTHVAFADPKLELAVRNQLGIPTAPLTPADLRPMGGLDAHNYEITNLSGIESAANLEWLILSDNPAITDYTPLTALPRLNYLNVNACNGSDIGFVAALAPLNELHLWRWDIADISPLAGHPQLVRLNLAYSAGITNLNVLDTLTNLESFWFERSGISNLSFAALMPKLRDFSFESSTVSDLTPLAGATNLVWMDMANNQITNAAPLAGCTNLEWLSAGGNQIHDLGFVSQLPKLSWFAVDRNAVEDLSPLTGRSNLTYLDIGWNPLTNATAVLGSLTHLTDLQAWHIGLSNNLGFLASLPQLRLLGLGENSITTLPPYPHLNGLRHLNLDRNPLTNLNFVAGMTNLADLYVNYTGIRDLSPLAGCTNLINLGLAGNGLTELAPLATLSHLGWITLWENNLQSIAALSSLTNLTYVDLRLNLLDGFGPNPTLTTIQTLQARGVNAEYNPQQPGAIFLLSPARIGGQFRFDVHGAPDSVLQIWSSTNLTAWQPAGFVTNRTGSATFIGSPDSAGLGFYRASPAP